jgi:hypothetical protein
MSNNLNEIITNEIKNELNNDLNQLKLNKQFKQTVDNKINDATIELTRFIIRSKIELLKQTNQNEKKIESNLTYLINKKNDLLNKLEENNINNYDEVITDYNELKSFKSSIHINFDYIFKKNEIIHEQYLSIGSLLVNIFN